LTNNESLLQLCPFTDPGISALPNEFCMASRHAAYPDGEFWLRMSDSSDLMVNGPISGIRYLEGIRHGRS
jgi:hypothetical protein